MCLNIFAMLCMHKASTANLTTCIMHSIMLCKQSNWQWKICVAWIQIFWQHISIQLHWDLCWRNWVPRRRLLVAYIHASGVFTNVGTMNNLSDIILYLQNPEADEYDACFQCQQQYVTAEIRKTVKEPVKSLDYHKGCRVVDSAITASVNNNNFV